MIPDGGLEAKFGVPEVKQGALGAATHMARLVPQHLMRTLYFTARTIKAADLVQFGSVLEVVPRDRLDPALDELRLGGFRISPRTNGISVSLPARPLPVTAAFIFTAASPWSLIIMLAKVRTASARPARTRRRLITPPPAARAR